MIGEIRDFETAQIAIQASLTGHLVLATLHTNDAPSAVTRLTDMGVEPFLLSSACSACWPAPGAQAVPRCKRADARGRYHPVGCAACGQSGYKGRTGVYELMVADEKVRSTDPQPRRRDRSCSSPPRKAACARCARTATGWSPQGITSPEEVMRVTRE
jgi:general secretion pathway protein E